VKHVPDLQAGEREEMPLLAGPLHVAAAASSFTVQKRQVLASSGRSDAGDPKSGCEYSGIGEASSSSAFLEVSSVLPWRRAYPHAKVVRYQSPELMPARGR
jgi:hypothetical protein